ncbi:unnamed protein product [Phytomonas sp. EM1]|nr:unnamed protein product [Phytomonas sp. EM1]|eukprot:CCW61963.1 unnamed protein product [Phytomonas sp. isolate EM1]
MLPVSLINTISIGILILLAFIILEYIYNSIQQFRLYKAYTCHSPRIFTLPFHQLVNYRLYELALQQYLAGIAIQHVEAYDRHLVENENIVLCERKYKHLKSELRFLIWASHLWSTIKGIFRDSKGMGKAIKTWKEKMKRIAFSSSDKQDASHQKAEIQKAESSSIIIQNSSLAVEQNDRSWDQRVHHNENGPADGVQHQTDLRKTLNACLKFNMEKNEKGQSLVIKSDETSLSVVGLYLGEALAQNDRKHITLRLRKTKVEVVPQNKQLYHTKDIVKSDSVTKSVDSPDASIQATKQFTKNAQDGCLDEVDDCASHELFLETQAISEPSRILSSPSQNPSTQLSPTCDPNSVQSLWGAIIRQEASRIRSELSWEKDVHENALRVAFHLSMAAQISPLLLERIGPRIVRRWLLHLQHMRPSYTTLFISSGVHDEGLQRRGSDATFDKTLLCSPHSFGPSQIPDGHEKTKNGDCLIQRTHGGEILHPSGATSAVEQGGGPVALQTGETQRPKTPSLGESGPLGELSPNTAFESDERHVCLETDRVPPAQTWKGDPAGFLSKREGSNLYHPDSPKRCPAGGVNTNPQNHIHSPSTTLVPNSNALRACSCGPGNQTSLNCPSGPSNRKLPQTMIRCFPLDAQDTAMLPRAHDQRTSYIIGADRDSLLRAITTDATRTFAHGFTNFVCFYTANLERETMRRHEAKKKLQKFGKMRFQSNESSDSAFRIDSSADDTATGSPISRAPSESCGKKVKNVDPSLPNFPPLVSSSTHSEYFTTDGKDGVNCAPIMKPKSEHSTLRRPRHVFSNGDDNVDRWNVKGKLSYSKYFQKLPDESVNEKRHVDDQGFQEDKKTCHDHCVPTPVSAPGQSYLIQLALAPSMTLNFHEYPLGCRKACPFREVVERHCLEAGDLIPAKHDAQTPYTSEKFNTKRAPDKRPWYSFLLSTKRFLTAAKGQHNKIDDAIPRPLIESLYVELGLDDVEISELALDALWSRLCPYLPCPLKSCRFSSHSFSADSFTNFDEDPTDPSDVRVPQNRTQGIFSEGTRRMQRGKGWIGVNPEGCEAQDVELKTGKFSSSFRYTLNSRASSNRRRQRLMEGLHNLKMEKLKRQSGCQEVEIEEDVPVGMAVLLFVPSIRTPRLPGATFAECSNTSENKGVLTSSRNTDEASKATPLEELEDTTETQIFDASATTEVVLSTSHQSLPHAEVGSCSPVAHFNPPAIVLPVPDGTTAKVIEAYTGPADGITSIVVETPPFLREQGEINDSREVAGHAEPASPPLTVQSAPSCIPEEESEQQEWDIVVLLYGATTSTILEALLEAEQGALYNEISYEKNMVPPNACENVYKNDGSAEDSSFSCISGHSRNININRRGVGTRDRHMGNDNVNTSFTFSLPNCSFTEAFGNDFGLISEHVLTSMRFASMGSDTQMGFKHDCPLIGNDAPCDSSVFSKSSIASTSPLSCTTSTMHVQHSSLQQQQHAAIVGDSSHGVGVVSIHRDPCRDFPSNAPTYLDDKMLNSIREVQRKNSGEILPLNRTTSSMTSPLLLQEYAGTPSPGVDSYAEPGVYLVRDFKEELDGLASGNQEAPPSIPNDVLAPVCDPIRFPQGLLLPIKLLYIRIANDLYRVTEVVDQSFTQYREKRVFKSMEAQQHNVKGEKGGESSSPSARLSNGPSQSVIDRMKSVFNTLMNNIPSESTNQTQSQGRPRRRPFSMNTAACDSVFSISPTTPPVPHMECQSTKMCWQCLSREARVIFLPCGHFAACENCSDAINRCYVCQTRILSTITLLK